ncbi:SRPBCC family protein [Natrinema soli]|uniref:SRPBCC domain-containing protein n=1 Tax=Natrinema soli TaxID=1930624 RepID=A0ABD5SLD3_9EURY|nr:SRPBCC family protein [Natrinema soli]
MTNDATSESDGETIETSLTIQRTFDAPRERVFRAFTDSDELEQWFAPGDLQPAVHTLEPEPDGELSVSFLDGGDRTEIEGTYEDVVEHERIVHTWNYPGESESRLTVEFRDDDGGCELVLTHERIGPSREYSAEENAYLYEEGWSSALVKLEAVLRGRGRTMTENTTDEAAIETSERTMIVSRQFDAPRERVFDAWTDPDQVDRWWGPDGFSTTTDEMDVTPGGVWVFEMVGPEGETFPNRIAYDEVERPESLAYTQGSPDDPEQFEVTVTFEEEAEDETELAMKMRFPSAADLDDALEFGADDGAEQTLGRLAEHLSRLDAAGGGER